MNAFDRYAPFIQDFIYSHDWESLRSIQVAAADAIFNTQDNVLLTASTASGKTEAAFFPILTEFWENPPASVGALYIGPLKALINNRGQFRPPHRPVRRSRYPRLALAWRCLAITQGQTHQKTERHPTDYARVARGAPDP